MRKQHRMTRDEFELFVLGATGKPRGGNGPVQLYVRAPFDIVPCTCRDVNCHGWRFVEVRAERVQALTYDAAEASV